MQDFQQNFFSPQFDNNSNNQMQFAQHQQSEKHIEPIMQKPNIFQNMEQNQNSNNFQIPSLQFNKNQDASNEDNMEINEINMNNIFNFNLNHDNQNQIMNNLNQNTNDNIINTNSNNKEIEPQNMINFESENKIGNKNDNAPKNIIENPMDEDLFENIEIPKKTKLENKFSFLFRIDKNIQHQSQKQVLAKEKYELQVKKIADFDTIEDFWSIFQHLRKPDSFRPGIEYFMFKEPVKPLWEDENNKNGGRFTIKLKRGYTTIIWEEMIFALIGGILPKEIKDEINGIVVTSKKEFNTLQIWFRNFDSKIIKELEKKLRELLVIPEEVKLEAKQFNVNNNSNTNTYTNNNFNINKKEYDNYDANKKKSNNNMKSGGYKEKDYYNNNHNKNNYYYGEGDYGNYNNNKDYKKNKYKQHKNKK